MLIFSHNKYPILIYSGSRVLNSSQSPSINSNFIYLTGLDIEDLVLFSYLDEIHFYGKDTRKIKLDTSKKIYHYPISKLPDLILKLEGKKIYSLSNFSNIPGLHHPDSLDISMLESICQKRRPTKSQTEIKKIETACQIVSQAIQGTWKELSQRSISNCQQLVNLVEKKIKKKLEYPSYSTICTTGENSTILHCAHYRSKIKNNLILLDIGFKYEGYCSDITRTFPLDTMTPEQKQIYEIVLEANEKAISHLKPRVSFLKIEKDIYLFLYQELDKLGLFRNKMESNLDKISFMKQEIMYHSLGHLIGLEVHDIGELDRLRENMVITIEPGIYFRKNLKNHPHINSSILDKYLDIGGIRIEDTVLITKTGSRILNKVKGKILPKKIKDIQKILGFKNILE